MASTEDAKFVVAIDFGTTFTKAAYAESPHLEKGSFAIDKMVHLITDWPSQQAGGGGKTFKTKSCVWYMPGPEVGIFELKGWGWDAYVRYKEHVQSQAKPDQSCVSEDMLSKRHGYLIDCFKLHLYNIHAMEELPKCLPLRRVISDFLRGMSTYILQELRLKHGRKVFKRDIQWCITVPALWEEHHKQTMRDCAELAGLVRGPLCTDNSVSMYDLITVLEPEAASVYCHNTLKSSWSGDTFVVADLGGGTTDLVTHQRIGRTRRSNIRVKEISWSMGGLFGGVHVDEQFLQHLRNEINYPNFECFSEFETLYPSHVLDLLLQWGRIKTEYKGEIALSKVYFLDLPITLAKMWKRSHRLYLDANWATGGHCLRNYHQMELKSRDVKRMFDKDIESILGLLKKTNKENVDSFLIVGGFSESPYVRARIEESFSKDFQGPAREKDLSKVIFPRDPDTAVVRGAVALGVNGEWESFVQSRIAKKTYGFDTTVPFDAKLHPAEHLVYDLSKGTKEKLCDHIFLPVVRRGEEVPFNSVVEYSTYPLYREGYPDDENVEITMYSTDATNPKFINDRGVTKEAACTIHVPRGVPCRGEGDGEGETQGRAPGEGPRLEVSVHFGGSTIRLTVWGTNFSSETVAMTPVRFISAAQNEREYQELLQKTMKNPAWNPGSGPNIILKPSRKTSKRKPHP